MRKHVKQGDNLNTHTYGAAGIYTCIYRHTNVLLNYIYMCKHIYSSPTYIYIHTGAGIWILCISATELQGPTERGSAPCCLQRGNCLLPTNRTEKINRATNLVSILASQIDKFKGVWFLEQAKLGVVWATRANSCPLKWSAGLPDLRSNSQHLQEALIIREIKSTQE